MLDTSVGTFQQSRLTDPGANQGLLAWSELTSRKITLAEW
jgi:hypothetical protein